MKSIEIPAIHQFGESAILLHWKVGIHTEFLYDLLRIKAFLTRNYQGVEALNTYDALLLKYAFPIQDFKQEKNYILKLLRDLPEEPIRQVTCHTLPVCYDPDLGWDLQEMSVIKEMDPEELIKKHTAPTYTIYFQGFLPGFLYLGGLDSALAVPRKRKPRLKVDKGAVGLAEHQTGIYPQQSAGGWQIIGNCPIPLFEADQEPPSVFSAGDKLKFTAVSLSEYQEIKATVQVGSFQWKSEPYFL